jgi:hypothetical protein
MMINKGTRVNPATRLTAGGILDILSLARGYGVKISVSWCEEGEYYILSVVKGDCVERLLITDSELDMAQNDELVFRHKLRYAIHLVTVRYDSKRSEK